MENSDRSSINLFKGIMGFRKEDPYWYRLIVLFMVIGFILVFALVLKEWALPAFSTNGFGIMDLFKAGKGRSP